MTQRETIQGDDLTKFGEAPSKNKTTKAPTVSAQKYRHQNCSLYAAFLYRLATS